MADPNHCIFLRFFTALFRSFLLLQLLTSQTTCTPVSPTFPLPTSDLNNSSNSLLNNSGRYIECVAADGWITPEFILSDCVAAINLFYLSAVQIFPTTLFEWVAINSKPWYVMPCAYTPKRFTHESCTLAFALPSDYEPRRKMQPSYDIGRYDRVYEAAVTLYKTCSASTSPYQMPGWTTTGSAGKIGVFLWAAGSARDRMLPADQEKSISPGLGTGDDLNATA